jgi:hypothetical protein
VKKKIRGGETKEAFQPRHSAVLQKLLPKIPLVAYSFTQSPLIIKVHLFESYNNTFTLASVVTFCLATVSLLYSAMVLFLPDYPIHWNFHYFTPIITKEPGYNWRM